MRRIEIVYTCNLLTSKFRECQGNQNCENHIICKKKDRTFDLKIQVQLPLEVTLMFAEIVLVSH